MHLHHYPICGRWQFFLSWVLFVTLFRNHESSLHRAFTRFFYIVCFFSSFGLCLLVFSFALYFWWMGSHPWFLFYKVFVLNITVEPNTKLVWKFFKWSNSRTKVVCSKANTKPTIVTTNSECIGTRTQIQDT
jgi:hypothetical protein